MCRSTRKISIDGKPLGMTEPENVRKLIDRGMRAQLQAQSLVTGLLFVQIDFFPDTPITFVLPQPSTPMELPTVPTALEEASSAAKEIITELRNVKFGPMVQNASEALESFNSLVSSPALRAAVDALPDTVKNANQAIADIRRLTTDVGGNVDPLVRKLDATMGDVDRMLTSVRETVGVARTVIEPGSPLDHDLRKALQDVSSAARAMGQLADYLERNPTALLYGKQPPPEVKR
jgi:paraquat-inducible protein B